MKESPQTVRQRWGRDCETHQAQGGEDPHNLKITEQLIAQGKSVAEACYVIW